MKKMFSFLIYILLIWCARSEEDEVFYPLTSSTDNPLSDITPEIGTEVSHRGWEFMVSLQKVYKENSFRYTDLMKHFCTGALIHKKWVLTTASCVKLWSDYDYGAQYVDYFVIAGVYDIETLKGGQMVSVNFIIVHEDWNFEYYLNDIALMKLENSLEESKEIKPIEPSQYYIVDHVRDGLRTAVWLQQSTNLLEFYITIRDERKCEKVYKETWNEIYPRHTQSCHVLSLDHHTTEMLNRTIGAMEKGSLLIDKDGNLAGLYSWTTISQRDPKFSFHFVTQVGRYYEWIKKNIEKGSDEKPFLKDHGYPAKRKNWLFLVSIRWRKRHRCTGSLITPSFIVTSDGCVTNIDGEMFLPDFIVRVGYPDLLNATAGLYEIYDIYVKRRRRYLDRKTYGYNTNDIALIRLIQKIGVSENYFISLPSAPLKMQTKCRAGSWTGETEGKESDNEISNKFIRKKRSVELTGRKAFTLVEKNMTIHSLEFCRQQYYYLPKNITQPYVDDTFLCAKSENKSTDICLGQFGAALVCDGVLWGISSWGRGCVSPGKYELWTRMDKYLSWIEGIFTGKERDTFGKIPWTNRKWKFMASIRANTKHICAGVLISEFLLLTKASCLEPHLFKDTLLEAVIGVDDIITTRSDFDKHTIINEKIFAHPGYVKWSTGFYKPDDVVLLTLEEKILDVEPIILYNTSLYEGQICKSAGWWVNIPFGEQMNVLKEVTHYVVDIQECRHFYDGRDMAFNYLNYLCTKIYAPYNDICMVERGAPLVCDGRLAGFGAMRYGCRENGTFSPTLWTKFDNNTYEYYQKWMFNSKLWVPWQLKDRVEDSSKISLININENISIGREVHFTARPKKKVRTTARIKYVLDSYSTVVVPVSFRQWIGLGPDLQSQVSNLQSLYILILSFIFINFCNILLL